MLKKADQLKTSFFGGLFNFSEDKGIGTFSQSNDWYTASFENNDEVNPEAKRIVSSYLDTAPMFSNKNIDIEVKRVKKSDNPQISGIMNVDTNGIDDIQGFDQYSKEIAEKLKSVESPEYGYIVNISPKGELDDNTKSAKENFAQIMSLYNQNKLVSGKEIDDATKTGAPEVFKEDGTVDATELFNQSSKYLQKKSIIEDKLPNASQATKEELLNSPTIKDSSIIEDIKYIPAFFSDSYVNWLTKGEDQNSQEAKNLVATYLTQETTGAGQAVKISANVVGALAGGGVLGTATKGLATISGLSTGTAATFGTVGSTLGSGLIGGGAQAIDRTFEIANDDRFTKTDVLAQAARAGLNFLPAFGALKTQSYIQNALGRKLGMTSSTALASLGTNTLAGGVYGAMDFGLAKMMGEKVSVTDYIPSIVAGNIIVGATIAKNFPELRANEKFVKGIKESLTAVLDHSAKTGLSYSDSVDALYPDGFKVDGVDFTENLRETGRSFEKDGRDIIASNILGTQAGKDAIKGVSDALGNVHKTLIENKIDVEEGVKKVMLADELETLSKDVKNYTDEQRQVMKDQALKYREEADISKDAIDKAIDESVGDKTLKIISETVDKIDAENAKIMAKIDNGDIPKELLDLQNKGDDAIDIAIEKVKTLKAKEEANKIREQNKKANSELNDFIAQEAKRQKELVKQNAKVILDEKKRAEYISNKNKEIDDAHSEYLTTYKKDTKISKIIADVRNMEEAYSIAPNVSRSRFHEAIAREAEARGVLKREVAKAKAKAIGDKGDKKIQKAEYEAKIKAIREKFKVDAQTKKEIEAYNKDKKETIADVKRALAEYRMTKLIERARDAMKERNQSFLIEDIMSDAKIKDLARQYARGDITIKRLNKEINKAIIDNIIGSYSILEEANGISRSESIKSVSELASKADKYSKFDTSEGDKQTLNTQIELSPEEIATNSEIYSINARESIKTLLLGAKYKAVQELKSGNTDGAITLLNDAYFTAKTLSDSINNVETLVADSFKGEFDRLSKIITDSGVKFGINDDELGTLGKLGAQLTGGQDIYNIIDPSGVTSQIMYETVGVAVQQATQLKGGVTTRILEINDVFKKAGKTFDDFRLYIIAKEGRAGNAEIVSKDTGEFLGYEQNIFYNNQTGKLDFVKFELEEKSNGAKGVKKLSAKYSIPTDEQVNKHISEIESNRKLKTSLANWKSLTDITGKVAQYGKYYTDGSILDITQWYIPELGKNVTKGSQIDTLVGEYRKPGLGTAGSLNSRVESRRFFEHTVDLQIGAVENAMHAAIDKALINPKLKIVNELINKGVLGGNNEKLKRVLMDKIETDFGRKNMIKGAEEISRLIAPFIKLETVAAMGIGQVSTALKQPLSIISFINRFGTKHFSTGGAIADVLGRKSLSTENGRGAKGVLEQKSGLLKSRVDDGKTPQGNLFERSIDSFTSNALKLSFIQAMDFKVAQRLVASRAAHGIDAKVKELGFNGELSTKDYIKIIETGDFSINGKNEKIDLTKIFAKADSEVGGVVMTSLQGQSPAIMKNTGLTSHLFLQKAPLVDFVSLISTPILKSAGKVGPAKTKAIVLASSASALAFLLSSLLSSEITNGVSALGNALVDEAKDNNSDGEVSLALSRYLRSHTVESLSRPYFKESSPTYELLKLVYGDKDAFGRAMDKTVKGMTQNIPFLGSFLSTDRPTSEIAAMKILNTVYSGIFEDSAKFEADLLNLTRTFVKYPGVKEGTKQMADTMKKYANEYADSYTFDQFKKSEEAKALKVRMAKEYLNLYRVNGEALKKGDISVLQEMMEIEQEKSPRKEGEKEKTYINRLNATVIRKMQDAGQLQGVPENVQNVVNSAYSSFSNDTKKKIVENGNKLENEIDDKAYLIRYNALGLGKDEFKTFLKDRLSRGFITSEKYKSVVSSYDKYSTDVFSLLLDYEKDLADFNYGEDLVTE